MIKSIILIITWSFGLTVLLWLNRDNGLENNLSDLGWSLAWIFQLLSLLLIGYIIWGLNAYT